MVNHKRHECGVQDMKVEFQGKVDLPERQKDTKNIARRGVMFEKQMHKLKFHKLRMCQTIKNNSLCGRKLMKKPLMDKVSM